ncbi:hypothetical protein CK203_058639 [Vitis vinifera]|uniref:Uncharacterized protein n=1 Tax=Vitis vinifera TaxID=29760 RepID=A0A438FTI2_VITVI|nr:hypothetical protein CK203_058639 [Vitis vinifera]
MFGSTMEMTNICAMKTYNLEMDFMDTCMASVPLCLLVMILAEITNTIALLRDAFLGLRQRIDGHQAQPVPIQGNTPHDSTIPPSPPSGHTIRQDHMVPSSPPPPVTDDTQTRIDRIEQMMRLLHVSNGVMSWDGYDDFPVVALPVEFHMPDIEIHEDRVPLFGLLVQALYGIEDGIPRGLWAYSSPLDSKGKKLE